MGNTISYNRDLKAGENNTKLGRYDDYEGGSVFKTAKEASDYIKKNHPNYSVYELLLPNDWVTDVDDSNLQNQGYSNLINDAMIIKVVDE